MSTRAVTTLSLVNGDSASKREELRDLEDLSLDAKAQTDRETTAFAFTAEEMDREIARRVAQAKEVSAEMVHTLSELTIKVLDSALEGDFDPEAEAQFFRAQGIADGIISHLTKFTTQSIQIREIFLQNSYDAHNQILTLFYKKRMAEMDALSAGLKVASSQKNHALLQKIQEKDQALKEEEQRVEQLTALARTDQAQSARELDNYVRAKGQQEQHDQQMQELDRRQQEQARAKDEALEKIEADRRRREAEIAEKERLAMAQIRR